MKKHFDSPAAFARHLAKLAAAGPAVTHHVLEHAAVTVERDAKARIGRYQREVVAGTGATFPAWRPLSARTEADKAAHGYPLDAPLMRTGAMRDSIGHVVAGSEAVVGTNDPKAPWHEFGTERIPPRPVLAPALAASMPAIRDLVRTTSAAWLTGRGWRRPRI